ncbi:MAG: tryptophan--tRNA ligase [Patescibacteria group bacterium]|nr:tryptophan--tRNA ligase [Patescibacteria group bacterium]
MDNKKEKIELGVEILTGIRPTGDLTVANYLGAVLPILKMQEEGKRSVLFVADLHALTTNEPAETKKYCLNVIADYVALGIDPRKTIIYRQSDVAEETTVLMTYLARHISVAELLRTPTLKEKMQTESEEKLKQANALLFMYPVLMAADILLQRSVAVPVGEDQVVHLEITRKLANRFNKKYGDTFPAPALMQRKALRLLSLRGEGKMSKSNPSGAIFLSEDIKSIEKKIKKAETAIEGEMTPRMESHLLLSKSLCQDKNDAKQIDALLVQHKNGEAVMGEFKKLMAKIIISFVEDFQSKRAKITDEQVRAILKDGAVTARKNAAKTLEIMKNRLY